MAFFENSTDMPVEPAERLIVALDVSSNDDARSIVDDLDDVVSFYKVGLQLFFRTHFNFVKELHERNKQVFLDLKLEDIPSTIQLAVQDHPEVEFIELMTLAGASQIIGSAKTNKSSATKFLLLTVLSSLDDKDMHELYGPHAMIDSVVEFRTRKAIKASCDGVIASGETVKKIRSEWFPERSDLLVVAPGIRPKGSAKDDHKRTLTPYEALRDGADYIVVGRPITKAKTGQRAQIARSIIEDIEKGREDYEKHKGNFGEMLQAAINQ